MTTPNDTTAHDDELIETVVYFQVIRCYRCTITHTPNACYKETLYALAETNLEALLDTCSHESTTIDYVEEV